MTTAAFATPEAVQHHPSDDPVSDYLRQIGRIPLLSREQEVGLAHAIEVGLLASETLAKGSRPAEEEDLRTLAVLGEEARQSLIRANLRLVVSIAKRYLGQGLSLLDLVQEGNVGLMRAVERFDHQRGFKFSTYGVWWIKQAILRAVSDQGRTIRIPAHLSGEVYRAGRHQHILSQRWGRPPTLVELATALDVTVRRARDLLGWSAVPGSLDAVVGGNDGSLADLVSDERQERAFDGVVEQFIHADLAAALDRLTERESTLLRMRFGLGHRRPHTLEELANEFGVTRERVRQLQTRAMSKLRSGAHSDTLRSYLR
jgi:RNA polymerase primary sigma factor